MPMSRRKMLITCGALALTMAACGSNGPSSVTFDFALWSCADSVTGMVTVTNNTSSDITWHVPCFFGWRVTDPSGVVIEDISATDYPCAMYGNDSREQKLPPGPTYFWAGDTSNGGFGPYSSSLVLGTYHYSAILSDGTPTNSATFTICAATSPNPTRQGVCNSPCVSSAVAQQLQPSSGIGPVNCGATLTCGP